MKRRKAELEKIETLIKKKGFSRRDFIKTTGKTIAISIIASSGLISLFSCSDNSDPSVVCTNITHDCVKLSYTCPASQSFDCQNSDGNQCLNNFTCRDTVNCWNNKVNCDTKFSCTNINNCVPISNVNCPTVSCPKAYSCPSDIHQGGAMS